MSTIDERIVAMKFNNSEFQKRISETLDSLADLKKGLNLDAAGRSLAGLSDAAKSVTFDPVAKEVDALAGKFEGLQAIATGALLAIGSKLLDLAISGAQKLGQAISQGARDGFAEYELQINSVQTILSNTAQYGTTIDDVNASLAELNDYADKTIYNFAAMTKNIGTFTVAGINLEDATASVKGFSNMAALAGADAGSAAGAMYQLSQAMSSGVVRLQDWISIERAGIAGVQFQEALIETARAHGIAIDQMIEENGSFRNSLQENWLSAEIMTQTLTAMTGDLNKEQLMSLGYTSEQADKMAEMAQRAMESATVVKTFTQLVGTYMEAVGSGWAQSWQLIVGDFEEAKILFTEFSELFNGMAGESADNRNAQLQIWKDMGGRTAIIDALRNSWEALQSVLGPIMRAFREVFPPDLGNNLAQFSFFLRDLTSGLILSEAAQKVLGASFKTFFQIIKFGLTIVGGFLGVIGKVIGALFSGGEGMSSLADGAVRYLTFIGDAVSNLTWVEGFFTGLGNVLVNVIGFIKDATLAVFGLVTAFAGFTVEGTEVALTRIRERLEQLGAVGRWFADMWDRITAGFRRFFEFISPITDALGEMFRDIGTNIVEAFSDVDFNTVLDLINVGLLGALVFMFKKFLDGGIWSLFGKGAKEGLVDSLKGLTGDFKKILGELTKTLEVMQTNIKADTLLKIAGALALLTASVVVLSLIDSGALTKALIAMGTMFYMLNAALVSFSKTAATVNIPAIAAVGFALILFATAIAILTGSVLALSTMPWDGLIKGLGGVLVLIFALSRAVPQLAKAAPGMVAAGIGLMGLAVAVRILVDAVAAMGALDLGQMIQGLVGVGAVLAGLLLFNRLAVANKGAIVNGVGLILLATALKILASAVSDFATMNVGALVQGIGALGVVLGVLAIFMNSTANVGQMIAFGTGLVILGASMKIMASAVSDFGSIPLENLVKGLLALAATLAIISLALLAMPPNTLVSAAALVVVGAALKIIASAMNDFGGMSWDEIGRGLVLLAGSLLIIAGALYLMTAALPGAAALLVVGVALSMIAPVLKMLGKMSWEEIGRGLVALAGAFGVIGLAGLVLAPLTPILLALGVAITLLGLGLGLIGAGVLAFALGLTILATAGLAALPVIVGLVMGILALIPVAMEFLAAGIVAFAKVIGDAAPTFLTAIVALLMTLLEGIQTVAPEVADTLLVLIEELLRVIVTAVPQFVDAGMKIIIGVLDGIAQNVGDLVDAGTDVVVEFLQGIQDNNQFIIDEGAKTIVSILEGIAAGIENNKQGFIDAGSRIFRAVVDGVASAIEQGGTDLAWAGGRIGEGIINGAMNALGINSPSKVFRDYIMGSVFEGIEDGGDKGLTRAARVGEDMGAVMVAGVAATIAGLASAIETDLDMSPTIRPVLDASQFRRDAQGLNASLSRVPVIRPSANAEQAYTVQREIDERTPAEALATPVPTKVVNVKMEQTNNSPEPLSTAEIYRRTNNQVSQVKGILEDEDVQ